MIHKLTDMPENIFYEDVLQAGAEIDQPFFNFAIENGAEPLGGGFFQDREVAMTSGKTDLFNTFQKKVFLGKTRFKYIGLCEKGQTVKYEELYKKIKEALKKGKGGK